MLDGVKREFAEGGKILESDRAKVRSSGGFRLPFPHLAALENSFNHARQALASSPRQWVMLFRI